MLCVLIQPVCSNAVWPAFWLALRVGPLSRAMSLLIVAQLVQSLCCVCTNVQQQGLIAPQTAAQGGVLILASQDARCHDRFSQVCLQLALITLTAGICFDKYVEAWQSYCIQK